MSFLVALQPLLVLLLLQDDGGGIGYKSTTSYHNTLVWPEQLAALQETAPIAAGDAVLQFDIVVTQLWYFSTEEVS
jgi:hypothetical protein